MWAHPKEDDKNWKTENWMELYCEKRSDALNLRKEDYHGRLRRGRY